jgi:glutathione S-transferase
LMRVPTLVLDDGFVLTDSHMILDHLDSLVAEPMFPRAEPARRIALKRAALATGLAEKAVSLFYERRLHATVSQTWEARCRLQIGAVAAALEADRATCPGPYFGARIAHEDVALACALRFVIEALPGVLDMRAHPALAAHCAGLEATEEFRAVYQPFSAPA